MSELYPSQPCAGAARVRILIALSMRLDREAMSRSLAIVRPTWEIHEVEPAVLDDTFSRIRPDVVICTEATEIIEEQAPMWFVLNPYGSYRCVVAAHASRTEEAQMTFPRIVEHIDCAYA